MAKQSDSGESSYATSAFLLAIAGSPRTSGFMLWMMQSGYITGYLAGLTLDTNHLMNWYLVKNLTSHARRYLGANVSFNSTRKTCAQSLRLEREQLRQSIWDWTQEEMVTECLYQDSIELLLYTNLHFKRMHCHFIRKKLI